jgi:hypothetical protein
MLLRCCGPRDPVTLVERIAKVYMVRGMSLMSCGEHRGDSELTAKQGTQSTRAAIANAFGEPLSRG